VDLLVSDWWHVVEVAVELWVLYQCTQDRAARSTSSMARHGPWSGPRIVGAAQLPHFLFQRCLRSPTNASMLLVITAFSSRSLTHTCESFLLLQRRPLPEIALVMRFL
jgi:hypothetical protein